MKKWLIVAGCVLGYIQGGWAYNVYQDILGNTKFTAIGSFGAAYYYSAAEGSDHSSQGGVSDAFFTYRDILTANIGWKNALSGNAVGDIVGGPGIKIDNLMMLAFGPYLSGIKQAMPLSIQLFLNSTFANLYGGWKSGNGAFDFGYVTGIAIRWN